MMELGVFFNSFCFAFSRRFLSSFSFAFSFLLVYTWALLNGPFIRRQPLLPIRDLI